MNYRDLFDGIESPITLHNQQSVIPINFDNGATTPPLKRVNHVLQESIDHYGPIGRGTGQKGDWSTFAYGMSRKHVLKFFNVATLPDYTVVYTKNTTESINLLAHTLIKNKSEKVLLSRMEHHSNDLPWRHYATPIYSEVDALGRLDLADLEHKLITHNKQIKYIAVTAASNVTGYKNPIHTLAQLAHHYGAKIIVDAAQLVAHEAINMQGSGQDDAIDYLVFSGHKMYAPYGSGAIVGCFGNDVGYEPFLWGGGTVDRVDDDVVTLRNAPQVFEGGTPNVLGALSLTAAMETLTQIGFDKIMAHEQLLKDYLLTHLRQMDDVILYGDAIDSHDRLGVISFNIKRKTYADVAMALADEWGIATRCGKFCAHPYVNRLLQLQTYTANELPLYYGETGMVRISLGLYNTLDEVQKFLSCIDLLCHQSY